MGKAANLAVIGSIADTSLGFRNRIINGNMVIDQRNAGAAVTANGAYPVDRFLVTHSFDGTVSAQRSTVAPAGFTNSLGFTVSSPDTSIGATQFYGFRQRIEGFNTADLGWGAAGAQTVTLSFWVRSSITGTYGATLSNSADNRLYPTSYTVNSANTWEQKTITVPGDTTGTWLTDNNTGLQVQFWLALGSTYQGTTNAWTASAIYGPTGMVNWTGTNGATFYITGVQLEAGTVASPFEQIDYGRELMMCQRYCWAFGNSDNSVFGAGYETAAFGRTVAALPVVMRASPTLSASSAASTFALVDSGSAGRAGTAIALAFASPTSVSVDLSASGTNANVPCILRTASASANIVFSSEL